MSEEVNAPEEGQEEVVGLGYGDIQACVQIIAVSTQRGAIRGDELMQVGTVRERLVGFLRHAQAQGEDVGEIPASPYNEAPAEAAE